MANPTITQIINDNVTQQGAEDRINASEVRTTLHAINSFIQDEVSYSTTIPFSKMTAYMAGKTLTTSDVLVPGTAGAVKGAGCVLRLTGNGSATPNLAAFKKSSLSADYVATNGVVNVLVFFYDGVDYWYTIFQQAGTQAPPAENTTPAAPTGGVVDDAANTFTFTPSTGFAATEHEYSINGGAYAACSSNVISVGNVAIPAGSLLVRVKAATGRNASPTLANAAAFTVATGPDADATAYITAEGITDATQQGAVDTLVKALKAGANTWSRIKGLYLFLGTGLKNARTPGTFDLTTLDGTTTPVFGANGVTFDGSNDYLSTGIIPSVDLGIQSESFGAYVKTAAGGAVMGTKNAAYNSYLFPTGTTFALQQPADITIDPTANGTARWVVTVRDAGGGMMTKRVLKSGVEAYTNNAAMPDPADRRVTTPFWLGACQNDGYATGIGYSACTLGLAFVGEGLTNTQMSELDAAIQNFITTLNRA